MAILTSPKIRFNVDEYFRMSSAGVFDDRRVELLGGRILQMHAQSNPHIAAITKTVILLTRYFGFPERFWLVVQGTCRIEPYDAPDPDFAVYDVPVGTPDANLPRPMLVIEVAQSSYKRDSGIKLRRYAAAGIADYWIVNIPQRQVEVYRNPSNPTGRKNEWTYLSKSTFSSGDRVKLLSLPEVELSVNDMLP